MNIKILSLLCFFISFAQVYAALRNTGTINLSKDSSIIFPDCVMNDGSIVIEDTAVLIFNKLEGNGLITIKAGKTDLYAREFEFKGTVECNGECVIHTLTKPEAISFIRKGNSKIVIQNDWPFDDK